MGFNKVYQSLMEVFPQVDLRLLRAVAFEHSKDADTAVEVVLTEVLPFLSSRSVDSNLPSHACSPSGVSDAGAEHEEMDSLVRRRRVCSEKNVGSSSGQRLEAMEDTSKADLTCSVQCTDSTRQEQEHLPTVSFCDANVKTIQPQENNQRQKLKFIENTQHENDNVHMGLCHTSEDIQNAAMQADNADDSQLCANNELEVLASLSECQNINNKVSREMQVSQVMPTNLPQESVSPNSNLTSCHSDLADLDGPRADDFDVIIGEKSPRVESCLDGTALEVENSVELTEDHPQFPISSINNYGDMGSLHGSKIVLLEEMIEAAKDNKKILFSAMESVMNMMKQVELQERAAEQAKEEASRAGLNTLAKVQELKQMLFHAKEANDMHAGEIYGERAILATEAKELQARLLSLSDERDKALAMLDEMREALQARLAVADELRKAAELEKWEKEESAQKDLTEQENMMETVVQESKKLQLYAEENSKLREFLMDRGRVIDTLQGEISVICQDGRLLKEKFLDERIPLSESISSSQTTCILASSGSSLKSTTSNVALELCETSEGPKQMSPTCSVDGQSPKSRHSEERAMASGKELLLEEGWDLLE